MTDQFSPIPKLTSNQPNLPDNFLPRPTLKSKGPKPSTAGEVGTNASNMLDARKGVSGDRSGQGSSAGRGSNREVRPEKVDKNYRVLP